jgi:flagellar hook protein FlgE
VIQVYDHQGTGHNVTFTFEKVSANTWDITATMNPAEGTITGFGEDNKVAGVSFNPDGSLLSIAGNSNAAVLVSHNPMTVGGAAANLTTALQSLDQHTPPATPYAAGDSITITGVDYSGNAITPVTVPAFIAGNPATVGDVITAINSAYGNAVASLDASGNITLTAGRSGQTPMSLTIADSLTNTGGSTAFSNFDVATPGTNGDPNIAFQITNLAGFGIVQTIQLDLGSPNSTGGVSQTGSGTSVAASNQDGYAEGTLLSSSVGADGIITGQFSNGQSKQIAQIGLATFTNPGGLISTGDNYFVYSTASGLPNVSAPLAGGAGSLLSGGLEGANVDVGTEFTQLITAQRGYQVNAKAFSVANTMMQDSIDLIR